MDLNHTRWIEDQRVILGEPLALEMSPGWVYLLPFNGEINKIVNATATGSPNAIVDTLIVILGPGGEPLVGDDDSGEYFGGLVSNYVLPADGTYHLAISHASGATEGEITVIITISSEQEVAEANNAESGIVTGELTIQDIQYGLCV
jgi:hypothetical protein